MIRRRKHYIRTIHVVVARLGSGYLAGYGTIVRRVFSHISIFRLLWELTLKRAVADCLPRNIHWDGSTVRSEGAIWMIGQPLMRMLYLR